MYDLIDMFFGKRSKREIKRDIIRRNQEKGKIAEDWVRLQLALQGYDIERTGRGHDYMARKRDFLTGRVVDTRYIEVKSSANAPLSDSQEKTKKRLGGRYKVIRYDLPFYF